MIKKIDIGFVIDDSSNVVSVVMVMKVNVEY